MKTTRTKPQVKAPSNADDKEQSERFIESAQTHGANEPDKAFERLIKKISTRKRGSIKSDQSS